jgi:hypothetical protein
MCGGKMSREKATFPHKPLSNRKISIPCLRRKARLGVRTADLKKI